MSPTPSTRGGGPRRPKEEITEEHIACAELLIETFKPRMDVYAERYDTIEQVESFNRWREGKPEKDRTKIPPARLGGWKPAGAKGKRHPVTVDAIARHVAGFATLGLYPLHPDNTCNSVSVDFDNHRGEHNTARDPQEDFDLVVGVLQRHGVRFLANISRGGWGRWVHLLPPVGTKAREARAITQAVLREAGVKHIKEGGTVDDLFPKQDEVFTKPDGSPADNPGNLFCIPCSLRWMRAENPGTHLVGTDPRSLAEQLSHLKEY